MGTSPNVPVYGAGIESVLIMREMMQMRSRSEGRTQKRMRKKGSGKMVMYVKSFCLLLVGNEEEEGDRGTDGVVLVFEDVFLLELADVGVVF